MTTAQNRKYTDLCGQIRGVRARLLAGASHTSESAASRPVSAALPCPNTVKLWGWERLSARTAARLIPCDYPRPHPPRLVRVASGSQKLNQEPEAMMTPTAAPRGDHAHALPTSAAPNAEERLAGLVVLLGDISESILGVRALVRDLESLQPGHGHVIGDALALAGFLADFGARYGSGKPSYEDAAEMLFSDRAMRAGVGA